MIKTLIVDDDFLVRSYLKQLKAWEQAGFTVVGEARDGEEALALIKEQKPDLVLTDITMPVMDGIDLIRKIKEEDLAANIVVLSCHDDFEYVREALKLGADEYVLKNTLNEDSLLQLLETVKKKCENSHQERSDKQKKEKLMKLGTQSLKIEFFNQMLAGNLTGLERATKAEEAGIAGRFYHSVVITACILDYKKDTIALPQRQEMTERLLHSYTRTLKELEEGLSGTLECIYLSEGYFCIFLDLSDETSQGLMQEKTAAVVAAIERQSQKAEGYEVVLGVSQISSGNESIRKAYLESREAIKYRFYQKQRVLHYKEDYHMLSQFPKEMDELRKSLAKSILSKQKSRIAPELENILNWFREHHVEGRQVLLWFKDLDKEAGIERDSREYQSIYEMDQIDHITVAYTQACRFGQELQLREDSSGSVAKAVEYIRGHYQVPMNLEDVADNIGLNPAYLSFLFKQETGVNFSNFLLSCRLDCAKGLLTTTDKKVKDIAALSGFNDYRYFCKTFKKTVGVRPADFRKEN